MNYMNLYIVLIANGTFFIGIMSSALNLRSYNSFEQYNVWFSQAAVNISDN